MNHVNDVNDVINLAIKVGSVEAYTGSGMRRDFSFTASQLMAFAELLAGLPEKLAMEQLAVPDSSDVLVFPQHLVEGKKA